jgi:MFS family permease
VTAVARPGGSGWRAAFSSLGHRDFALFWSAALVSNSGTWMQTVTVPYVLYHLTDNSATWLGLAAFMQFFPAVVVGPLAGTLADRVERRRVLIVTQSVQMLVAFSLWGFWVSGQATPGIILLHLLVSGIASGINIASWQSFVPLLVPHEDMLNAVRLNSMQFTGARAFGPALAGFVLGRFGPSTAFLFNAVTFLLVIAVLFMVSPRPHAVVSGATFRQHFLEGLAYIRRRSGLVLSIVTVTVIAFFGSSLIQLAPAFASSQFKVGAGAYGLLVTAFGCGAIVGAVVMSVLGERVRRSRMALAGTLILAAGALGLALATRYAVGVAAVGVMGVAYLLVAVSLNTAVQAGVSERYRGRVVSIYLMGLLAGLPVGALVEGRLGDLIGLRPTVVASSVALFAFVVLALISFHGLRAIDLDLTYDDEDEAGEALAPATAAATGVYSPPTPRRP